MAGESEQQERLELDVTDPEQMPTGGGATERRPDRRGGPEEQALHIESDSGTVESWKGDLPQEQ